MTDTSEVPEAEQPTLHEQYRRDTLYITDAEMIRRLGVPEKIAREAIRMLDNERASGFPRKQKLWGDRRYWPAVKAYHDASNGLNVIRRIDAARLIPESRAPHPVAAPSYPMRGTRGGA